MNNNRLFKHSLICALILITGLGFALALPWPAGSQGLAAKTEVDEQVNAPEATRYFVAETGSGSPGTSWVNAFTNLQDALSAANSGDEIWVAAGVYYPDQGVGQINNSLSSTFRLKENVSLYGGFISGDNSLSDRDWVNNVTVLSGDIDDDDTTDSYGVVMTTTHIVDDNAFHVVSAEGITNNTVLDGFTITAGQANDMVGNETFGGGFFCNGSGAGNTCSPFLINVEFSGNFAYDNGGAMFNDGSSDGNSSPTLRNVTFTGNSSVGNGGAMYNNGHKGTSNPSLTNVAFVNNSSGQSGAMLNFGYQGNSSPNLIKVHFSENKAEYGGAMYNVLSSGSSNPTLKEVTFTGNSADFGGAMGNLGSSGSTGPSLSDVTFSDNNAKYHGGAVYNEATSGGNSSPSMNNVTFFRNKAEKGGAIYNLGDSGISSPSLRNITFSGNMADYGGAIYNFGYCGKSSPSFWNVAFFGNSADLDGGGIYNNGSEGTSSPNLINVVFSGNKAVFRGGAMYSDGSENGDASPIFTNVTFSGNFAGEIGGGIYNYGYDGNSTPLVQNSILWNNKDNSGTEPLFGNIYNNTATVNVKHTIIQGSEGSSSWTGGSYVDSGGNIDENPIFVEPIDPNSSPTTMGNLHLQSNSPAIDAGDNSFINSIPTDLDGEPRIIDGDKNGTLTVDMGAYEYIEYLYDGYIPLIIR